MPTDYCKNCNLYLLTDKERKNELCRFCYEKLQEQVRKLPKIGVVLGEQVVTFEKNYFKK